MVASDWKTIIRGENVPKYSKLAKAIQKSPEDEREYGLIRLENGLAATLVHDAKSDKAVASLNVAVGHLDDPDDMPGLAHFCEHLLFMGTEQFPIENDYNQFISKNNGTTNAYTASSDTCYFFEVSAQALAPALTRFAAFFHCPLFTPSCTSRELDAVNSEAKMHLQSDLRRIYQLNKHLSKDGHVWRKFGTGNRETLSQAGRDLKAKLRLQGSVNEAPQLGVLSASKNSSVAPTPDISRSQSPALSLHSSGSESQEDGGFVGRETRRRLIEWWKEQYCAGRMHLCVIGKESIDELADLVSTLFSPIQNRGKVPLTMIPDHPFGPREMGTLISVKTVMKFHAVEISFPLPYQPPLWRHKPALFLSHFCGHEGPGSLHSFLKKKGWSTDVYAGPQALGRAFAMFKVTIYLTAEGFQNYREVMLATFKYLSLLRSSNFPSWYQAEQANLSNLHFRFQEKQAPRVYATWITENMQWPVPPELTIAGPQITWEWDDKGEQEMRDILNCLTISNGRAVLMARGEEHEKIAKGGWEKEPYFETEYRVVRFDDEFVKQAEGLNDMEDLFLPGPNEFIPTRLDVDRREVAEPVKRPNLILETPLLTLWHKKDDQFWLPKANVFVGIRSPLASDSPRSAVLTRLYIMLVNEALTEFVYDASLADLSYNLASYSDGVWFSVKGYNDKLSVFARHVLLKAKDFVVHKDRLEIMKEQAKQDWTNVSLGAPYQLSLYHGHYLLSNRSWTLDDKLKEVTSVTVEEVQSHAKKLLEKVSIQMLVCGNVYKDEAIRLAEMVQETLSPSALTDLSFTERALLAPTGSNYIWKTPVPNPNEANSALLYYLHFGTDLERPLRVTSALLKQILAEPSFNVLRTQEQLGYVVFCSKVTLPGEGHAGLRIVVQSERGPAYVEERVERFLESMQAHIEKMGDEEFQENKAGLQAEWREKWKKLNDESATYWSHVESGYLDFYRLDQDANFLTNVTKQDVLDLFMSRIHPAAPNRTKLAIHMHSQKPRPKGISKAAAQAFNSLVRASGVVLPDDGEGQDQVEGKLTVAAFVAKWKDVLGDMEQAKELLDAIPALAEKYPVEGEDDDLRREGAVYIEDLESWKEGLELAEEAKPLVDWGDLPVSKF